MSVKRGRWQLHRTDSGGRQLCKVPTVWQSGNHGPLSYLENEESPEIIYHGKKEYIVKGLIFLATRSLEDLGADTSTTKSHAKNQLLCPDA